LKFDHIKEIIQKVDDGAAFSAVDGGTVPNIHVLEQSENGKNLPISSYKTTLAVACKNYDGIMIVGIQRCEVMVTEKEYSPFYFPYLNRGIWKRMTEGPYLDINRFANASCSNKIMLVHRGW
jgi:hypothetical protein